MYVPDEDSALMFHICNQSGSFVSRFAHHKDALIKFDLCSSTSLSTTLMHWIDQLPSLIGNVLFGHMFHPENFQNHTRLRRNNIFSICNMSLVSMMIMRLLDIAGRSRLRPKCNSVRTD